MSDVFAQVKMCERNRRPPLIYVVLFGTVCLGLLLEAQDPVTNASQKRDFKILNLTVTDRNFQSYNKNNKHLPWFVSFHNYLPFDHPYGSLS